MSFSSRGKRDFLILALSGGRAGGGCSQFGGSTSSDTQAGGAVTSFSATDRQRILGPALSRYSCPN